MKPRACSDVKSGKPRRQKKKQPEAAATIATLQDLSEQSRLQYGKAAKTRAAYTSYVRRGKEFLAQLVAARRMSHEKDEIDTNLLEKAFEKPPNQYSTKALEFFLVEKCIRQGCTRSTAEGVQAAFADYWDHMDGDNFSGEFRGYDDHRGRVTGCPARSNAILSIMSVIKNKNGIKGAHTVRNHAEAMTLTVLTRIVAWSEAEVPVATVEDLVSADLTSRLSYHETAEIRTSRVSTSPAIILHVLMRAFMASGFTLWTRFFELCRLQGGDLEMDCVSDDSLPYFKVTLVNRKGWQHDADGDLQSQTYEIYQQSEYAMDMYTHLLRWIHLYERLLGRKLSSGDFVFPYLAPNGIPHPDRETQYETMQGNIDKFTTGAGLTTRYTTHCFRRGGAQYRFMNAPRRWSLARIRWWGGWAKGEHTDTLTRYLVDSLQGFENNHSDALHPAQLERHNSSLSSNQDADGAKLSDLLTSAEFRAEMSAKVRDIKDVLASITTGPHTCAGLALPQERELYHYHRAPTTYPSHPLPLHHTGGHATSSSADAVPASLNPIWPAPHTGTAPPNRTVTSSSPIFPPSAPPGLRIDDLKRGTDAWRQAVYQWEVAAADGIPPLKSWKTEWFTGGMEPLFAAKRGQRKTIAEELDRLNGDTAAFLQQWPMATRSVSELLKAIRRARTSRRTTSNGTPAERDEREARKQSGSNPAVSDSLGPFRSNRCVPRHQPY
ncbi:hypothetical protein JOM56_002965 [Amanita muscaria]